MLSYASAYAMVPRGTSSRAVQLINLSTVNYILWGLQVGSKLPGGNRWRLFFDQLCRSASAPHGRLASAIAAVAGCL